MHAHHVQYLSSLLMWNQEARAPTAAHRASNAFMLLELSIGPQNVNEDPGCRLCARILTALGSLHHSMESGHLRLGLCVVYRPLLEELRQDVAAALTALSGLVLGTLSGVPCVSQSVYDTLPSNQGLIRCSRLIVIFSTRHHIRTSAEDNTCVGHAFFCVTRATMNFQGG